MPNIALTTYCNLHCPYCFADTMIQTEDIKNISLDKFKDICHWILKDKPKNEIGHIGLIGGEPTLHPQFKEILSIMENIFIKEKCEGILFTNGVYLEKFLPYIPEKLHILINVNTPDAMNEEQWNKMNSTLDEIYSLGWFKNKVIIGCNICMEIDNYDFLWSIVDKYGLRNVRVSVTAPTKEEYKQDKDKYYQTMLPKFVNFVKEAKKHSVKLNRDCNQIPDCYYENIEDLQLVKQICRNENENEDKKQAHCGPVVDITPDFTASACFGAYEIVDCNLFNKYSDLEYYLLNKIIMPKFINNCTGKCSTCKKHELFTCQGGCLAFSKINKKGCK